MPAVPLPGEEHRRRQQPTGCPECCRPVGREYGRPMVRRAAARRARWRRIRPTGVLSAIPPPIGSGPARRGDTSDGGAQPPRDGAPAGRDGAPAGRDGALRGEDRAGEDRAGEDERRAPAAAPPGSAGTPAVAQSVPDGAGPAATPEPIGSAAWWRPEAVRSRPTIGAPRVRLLRSPQEVAEARQRAASQLARITAAMGRSAPSGHRADRAPSGHRADRAPSGHRADRAPGGHRAIGATPETADGRETGSPRLTAGGER